MSSKYTEYHAQLINARTGKAIDDDTGVFIVLTAGEAQPQPSIYSDKNGTAIAYTAATSANTMTDGEISFWTNNDISSVDLTIVTATGHSIFIAGFTPNDHRIEVDQTHIRQVMVAPYYTSVQALTATGSAWGNGLSLPAKSLVHSCYIRTTVLGTTATHDFGISGNANGLYAMATTAVTGFHLADFLICVVTATSAVGSLFMGTGATNTSNKIPYLCPAATGIVWQANTVTVLAAAAGYIYLTYDVFQTA